MKQSFHIKIMLLVSALLLAFVALGDYLFFRSIKASVLNVAKITRDLREESLKMEQYKMLSDISGGSPDTVNGLNSHFIKDDQVVEFVERLGDSSGATTTIVSLKVLPISEEYKTVEKLMLEIEVGGRRENVSRFISLIENLPYGANIENVAIREDSGAAGYWEGYFVVNIAKTKKI